MTSPLKQLEAFFDEHEDALALRKGSGLDEKTLEEKLATVGVEVPSGVREVLLHYGWLEAMVSPELWSYTMFADGIRFFGFGDDVPEDLSMARQVADYRAFFDKRARQAEEYEDEPRLRFHNFEKMRRRSPVLATLEGLGQSWVSDGRDLAWFNDEAVKQSQIIYDEILPNDSPFFEAKSVKRVVELLLERLAYRVGRARLLRAAYDALSELGEVSVDGTQSLRVDAFSDVVWRVKPCDGVPSLHANAFAGWDLSPEELAFDPAPACFFRGRWNEPHGSPTMIGFGFTPGSKFDHTTLRAVAELLHGVQQAAQGDNVRPVAPQLERFALGPDRIDDRGNLKRWVSLR